MYPRSEVTEYARTCDLIVELPCIGDHSRSLEETPAHVEQVDDLFETYGVRAPRLAFFHGSRLLGRDWQQWSAAYTAAGYKLAASTLDYAGSVGGCVYIPSIVDVGDRRAEPYDDPASSPIAVIASTDPMLNRSVELEAAAKRAGCRIKRITALTHAECLYIKAQAHVGIDQIRGTFAINSLENMALGLANVVDVPLEQRDLLKESIGVEWQPNYPRLTSPQDVYVYVKWLTDSPIRLAAQQMASRRWFAANWRPEQIAAHVARKIRGILAA